jgi:Arc/MetJ-type ribon-helix-helix transcriptional regulator
MVEDSITITVSGKENVEWIRDKVRNGQFASETEVVAQSLSTLRADEAELEVWLKDVVAVRYNNHKATPVPQSQSNRSNGISRSGARRVLIGASESTCRLQSGRTTRP